jgi:transposase InsO family protein
MCGPMSQVSFGGARYLVIFIDDYSRMTFGYLMKAKSEVFSKFQIFKAKVEKQTGKSIKILRSDNGKEYINKQFEDFLQTHGISH